MNIVELLIYGAIETIVNTGVQLTVQELFGNVTRQKSIGKELVLDNLVERINEIEDRQEKMDMAKTLLETKNEYTDVLEYDIYQTNFAKRIDYILFEINKHRRQDDLYNIERLASYLNFKSVNDLKKYYLQPEEPTFDFVDNIAKNLGLNKQWLKFGIQTPFSSGKSFEIESLNAKVRWSGSYDFAILKDYEMTIVKREGGLKAECLSSYHFNSRVGASGRAEIKDMYDALVSMKRCNRIGSGYYLNKEEYNALKAGHTYAGALSDIGEPAKDIIYNFIDVNYSTMSKEDYRYTHGEEFVKMQDIVRNVLSDNVKENKAVSNHKNEG